MSLTEYMRISMNDTDDMWETNGWLKDELFYLIYYTLRERYDERPWSAFSLNYIQDVCHKNGYELDKASCRELLKQIAPIFHEEHRPVYLHEYPNERFWWDERIQPLLKRRTALLTPDDFDWIQARQFGYSRLTIWEKLVEREIEEERYEYRKDMWDELEEDGYWD